MPWCEHCSKYRTPSSLNADGTCPTCGAQVGEVEERAASELEQTSAPWHFKLLIVLLVIYLTYRFFQMVF
ncbi:MAG: hypothetical protein CSA55_05445 [Ilumatobacter coccineus]|uniref:Uncharacterized protein n=1 Tax=Ilumatobacter coccineus TaxID=467094 RepID=A0A2G6K774_9ACTN|nr:MAG: hypothetical protein CSA55_05445 [Ilumatobacter coccineus]